MMMMNAAAAMPGQKLPYIEEAGLNAAIILQQQIFSAQLDLQKSLSKENRNAVIKDVCISDVLLGPSRRFGNSRYLDNEEITLLSLLDSDGRLSMSSRMTQFMIMMTRVTRLDHRALLVEVLSQHTSESCEKQFVLHGGLRLLKLWIKIAEEENNLHELIALVRLCRKLPFDEKAIKETGGIGKSIKKLLKYKNPAKELSLLHEEVHSLMDHWTQQVHIACSNKKADSKALEKNESLPQFAVLISDKLVLERGPPKEETDSRAESKEDSRVETPIDSNETFSLIESHLKKSTKESTVDSKQQDNNMDVVELDDTKDIIENIILPPKAPLFAMSAVPPVVVQTKAPSAITAVVREKKVADMAEGARKLLAMKAQAQSKATEGKAGATDNSGSALPQGERKPQPSTSGVVQTRSEAEMEVVVAAPVLVKPPLKGVLKKSGAGKKNIGIQWADEHGLALREVHTIEVEKIKNSIANYYSHRDLVKKERKLEKETHLSKVHDAMQRTTEWRAPKPLVLSIDVLSNREAPVESSEKDAQTRRLGLVLEVRYLDDSLIPNDPDDSIAVAFDQQQQQLQLQQPPEPVKAIPWGSPGTDAHASQSQFDPFFPPYQQQEQQHQHNSQQYNSEQFRGYRSEEDSPAVAGLPRSLQLLGPQLLQRIVQDPALLQSLLNHDGTVNEQRVFQLQESVDTQYPSQRSQSRFGPYADDRFVPPPSDYPTRGGMPDRYADGGGSFPRRDQQQHGSRATRFGEKNNLPFFPEGPPGAGGGGGAMDPTGNRRGRSTRWGDMATPGDMRSLQQPQAPQYPREGFDDGRHNDQPYPPPRHGGRDGGMFPEGDDQSGYGHLRGTRFADDDAIMEKRVGDWDNREPAPYGDRLPSLDGGSFHPDDGYNNKADGSGYGQPPQRKKVGAAKQSRFPSAKAAVPCRFFNTRKGCQFGDKCDFGHFSAGAVPNLPGPPQTSGAAFAGPDSGPGSRPHHFKGPGGMVPLPPTGFDNMDDEYATRPLFATGGVPNTGGMAPIDEGDFMQQKRVRR